MSVTIELPPETEAALRAKAAQQGVSLAKYVSCVVEEAVPLRPRQTLSPAERAALLRKMSRTSTGAPPLSDEAISRESIYDTRG